MVIIPKLKRHLNLAQSGSRIFNKISCPTLFNPPTRWQRLQMLSTPFDRDSCSLPRIRTNGGCTWHLGSGMTLIIMPFSPTEQGHGKGVETSSHETSSCGDVSVTTAGCTSSLSARAGWTSGCPGCFGWNRPGWTVGSTSPWGIIIATWSTLEVGMRLWFELKRAVWCAQWLVFFRDDFQCLNQGVA